MSLISLYEQDKKQKVFNISLFGAKYHPWYLFKSL